MALPRVIPQFFFFFFFFSFFPRPFLAGCLGLIPGFFCFFFRPFSAGSLCMVEPASVYFKWRCPGLILGFFFFFFSPFSDVLPRVDTRVLLLLLFFPPLTDGPTQAIAFLKIKNMANLVKQCRGAS